MSNLSRGSWPWLFLRTSRTSTSDWKEEELNRSLIRKKKLWAYTSLPCLSCRLLGRVLCLSARKMISAIVSSFGLLRKTKTFSPVWNLKLCVSSATSIPASVLSWVRSAIKILNVLGEKQVSQATLFLAQRSWNKPFVESVRLLQCNLQLFRRYVLEEGTHIQSSPRKINNRFDGFVATTF